MPTTLRYSLPSINARFEPLDGPLNFRDVGGYAAAHGRVVRERQLFRSDSHDALSAHDADHLMDQLGIRAVVDLRTPEEVHRSGRSLLQIRGIPTYHIAIIDQTRQFWENGDTKLSAVYLTMLDNAAPRFVAAIRLIAALDRPTVFHCAAGKDRTGLLTAMVLDLLGVDDDTIADDYALTANVMPAMRYRFDERMSNDRNDGQAIYGQMPDDLRDEMLSARASTMHAVMTSVRTTHGSLSGWLVRNGLDRSIAQILRDRLVY